MTEETPVLSALAEMTAVSIERGTLPARGWRVTVLGMMPPSWAKSTTPAISRA